MKKLLSINGSEPKHLTKIEGYELIAKIAKEGKISPKQMLGEADSWESRWPKEKIKW